MSKAKKPEPSGMVDSAEARLWLARYKAHVSQLAKELGSMTDAEAFASLYRLRCRLWYEQEDYAMAGGGEN